MLKGDLEAAFWTRLIVRLWASSGISQLEDSGAQRTHSAGRLLGLLEFGRCGILASAGCRVRVSPGWVGEAACG